MKYNNIILICVAVVILLVIFFFVRKETFWVPDKKTKYYQYSNPTLGEEGYYSECVLGNCNGVDDFKCLENCHLKTFKGNAVDSKDYVTQNFRGSESDKLAYQDNLYARGMVRP